MRSDGFIEELFVSKTGQHVHAGEPLFRVYSPDIQRAQIDLLVAMGASSAGGVPASDANRNLEGAMQRLRNLGVPESRIREVRETGANPRTLDWPAPATGDVIEKKIINGQRVQAGDELYRIADHSHLWVIADVAEGDLSAIKIGTRATRHGPRLPGAADRGRGDLHLSGAAGRDADGARAHRGAKSRRAAQGRHVRRRRVPGRRRRTARDRGSRAAPSSTAARVRSCWSPRAKAASSRGRSSSAAAATATSRCWRASSKGEEVVTSATFLIDAESNLKAALQAFTQPEAPK